MRVIGVKGGMNCCFPSGDSGSSSTRKRITPLTPTIPAGKSRTRNTSADPIPPQMAIMSLGVTSTAFEVFHTTIEQLKLPPHAAVLQCPSDLGLVPKSNRQIVDIWFATGSLLFWLVIGGVPIGLSFKIVWCLTTSFRRGCKRHVGRHVIQLCIGVTWQKKPFAAD